MILFSLIIFSFFLLKIVEALHAAGVTVLGGPRAVELGVVGEEKVSPGFKTEYGELTDGLTCLVFFFSACIVFVLLPVFLPPPLTCVV